MHQIWKCKVSNISNRLRSKPLDKYARCLSPSLPPVFKFLLAGAARPRPSRVLGKEFHPPHFTYSSPFAFHTISSRPSHSLHNLRQEWINSQIQSPTPTAPFPFQKWPSSSSLGNGIEALCWNIVPCRHIYLFLNELLLSRVPRKKTYWKETSHFANSNEPLNSKGFNEVSFPTPLLPQGVKKRWRGCPWGWKTVFYPCFQTVAVLVPPSPTAQKWSGWKHAGNSCPSAWGFWEMAQRCKCQVQSPGRWSSTNIKDSSMQKVGSEPGLAKKGTSRECNALFPSLCAKTKGICSSGTLKIPLGPSGDHPLMPSLLSIRVTQELIQKTQDTPDDHPAA